MERDILRNYYALLISILTDAKPEQAFKIMEIPLYEPRQNQDDFFTEEDYQYIKELREQGLTWKAISKIYGMTEAKLYNHVKYRKGGMID